MFSILDNGGRRLKNSRRRFSFTKHIPERRNGIERRSGKDRRSGLDRRKVFSETISIERRSGIERRASIELSIYRKIMALCIKKINYKNFVEDIKRQSLH